MNRDLMLMAKEWIIFSQQVTKVYQNPERGLFVNIRFQLETEIIILHIRYMPKKVINILSKMKWINFGNENESCLLVKIEQCVGRNLLKPRSKLWTYNLSIWFMKGNCNNQVFNLYSRTLWTKIIFIKIIFYLF